jgi:mRNA interferase YafQ
VLKIKIEKSFKKDIEKAKKSGNYSNEDFELLKKIIENLENERKIKLQYKRHPLKGDMKGYESIHIKSDWLLVFKIDAEYLNLAMLGKHTQVYKKFK